MRIKILRNKCALVDIINHGKARELFSSFLKAEYADESLLFYDAAIAYRATYDLRPAAQRQEAAQAIVDEYLPDGAPRQINVPSGIQQKTIKGVKDGPLSADVFEEARQEVYTLMAKDSLSRFEHSQPFEKLLDHFGSYDLDTVEGVSSKQIELDLELMAA